MWKGELVTLGYCSVHDPVKVAERQRKRKEKWDAERAAEVAKRKAKEAERDLGKRAVEALRRIADGHNDPRSLAQEVLKAREV